MSDGKRNDEIESLNPERLNVEALSAEDLEQVSGGGLEAGVAPFECGDFKCPGTFTCSSTFTVTAEIGPGPGSTGA